MGEGKKHSGGCVVWPTHLFQNFAFIWGFWHRYLATVHLLISFFWHLFKSVCNNVWLGLGSKCLEKGPVTLCYFSLSLNNRTSSTWLTTPEIRQHAWRVLVEEEGRKPWRLLLIFLFWFTTRRSCDWRFHVLPLCSCCVLHVFNYLCNSVRALSAQGMCLTTLEQ